MPTPIGGNQSQILQQPDFDEQGSSPDKDEFRAKPAALKLGDSTQVDPHARFPNVVNPFGQTATPLSHDSRKSDTRSMQAIKKKHYQLRKNLEAQQDKDDKAEEEGEW